MGDTDHVSTQGKPRGCTPLGANKLLLGCCLVQILSTEQPWSLCVINLQQGSNAQADNIQCTSRFRHAISHLHGPVTYLTSWCCPGITVVHELCSSTVLLGQHQDVRALLVALMPSERVKTKTTTASCLHLPACCEEHSKQQHQTAVTAVEHTCACILLTASIPGTARMCWHISHKRTSQHTSACTDQACLKP